LRYCLKIKAKQSGIFPRFSDIRKLRQASRLCVLPVRIWGLFVSSGFGYKTD